ncbi:MAG: sulfotransferase [Anaerolineales bacterium]|nr:sulfotransferase [Anaerolineales bacterium]
MTMPNFLIIGAPKSGTTTLHYILDQHPEIYMSSIKEPGFFWAYGEEIDLQGPSRLLLKHRIIRDFDDYVRLFDGVTTEKAIGESSASYMFHLRSPELIHQFIPHAKLIFILRQPADRAFSSYTQYLRDGVEPCSEFAEAVAQEKQGLRDHWTFGRHLQYGFYYRALQRYLNYFTRQQMHISLFEDLKNDPQGLLSDIFRFLGVSDDFVVDLSHQHNVSGVIRNPLLRFFWTRSNRLRAVFRPLTNQWMRHTFAEWVFRSVDKPGFSQELRLDLIEYYRKDIELLQDFLHRDLSSWLNASAE